MKFYRAMSEEEFKSSMKFIRRFKWITPNLPFILNRVKDGKFNNSHICKDRYTIVVSFEIRDIDLSKLRKLNHNEYMMDRRKNVKFYNFTKIN